MTIEAAYQMTREQTRRMTVREMLHTMLMEARRAERRSRNLSRITAKKKSERRATMARAVSRMHGDDLDAAWRAALRGDMNDALIKVADHVTTPAVEPTGTPWRLTGWLSRKG
jgi:hypothetical protein